MFNAGLGRISRSRKKWQPVNEQQRKLFESAKNDLTCFMTVNREGVNANKLYSKMIEATDTEIKFRKMGFFTFGEFLYECKDMLKLKTDSERYYVFLRGSGPEDIDHVRDLVKKASKKTKYKGFLAKEHNTYDVPIETLLDLSYDLRAPVEPPPNPEKAAIRYYNNNDNYGNNSSLSSVPQLTPLNNAAVALQARTGQQPFLQPQRRSSQSSFKVRKNLPPSRSMQSLQRTVTPGMLRAVEMSLDNGDDFDDREVNYFDSDSSDGHPSFVVRREDKSVDKVDGTAAALTSSLLKKKSAKESLASLNINQESPPSDVLLARQMKLPEVPFKAFFLGADPFGFIYLQMACPVLQASFQSFRDQMTTFYSDTKRQDEFRVLPKEMETGNLVVGRVKSGGYCRGRIDEIWTEMEYCVIFGIDDCGIHHVKFEDMFHLDPQFSCSKLSSMVIMCIQRGTEQLTLTSQFQKIFERALPYFIDDKVEVTEASDSHPLLKVPILTIMYNEHNVGDLLCGGKGIVSRRSQELTSLTVEQQETMDMLDKKHHIILTK